MEPQETGLARRIGLLGLTATGVCSMIGAAINVIPVTIQRTVPGLGPYVVLAYVLAAVPAILAGLAYAILASAMPRAGGSYIFASRGLHPYLGFVASFSQWFGLSMAMSVVAYLLAPFIRDVLVPLGSLNLAEAFDQDSVRIAVALGVFYLFVAVNLLGVGSYQRILIPLMFLMFMSGLVVIPTGFYFDHQDFSAAVFARERITLQTPPPGPIDWGAVLSATAVLFATFIGFDSISQAGGEAKNPKRDLPLAIGLAVVGVGLYYLTFTTAVYHAVPWPFIAERALAGDVTAPGLMGYLLSPGWTAAIVGGAALGLINDFPAMILTVSRLMFAWAEDGIFPTVVRKLNRRRAPSVAIFASALMTSFGILGCHLAGDFFFGVDLLNTSMLANFLLMSLSVLFLPVRNPGLAAEIAVIRARPMQILIGLLGVVVIGSLLVIQVIKDLGQPKEAWYFHSTWLWMAVVGAGSLVFLASWLRRRHDPEFRGQFQRLPLS